MVLSGREKRLLLLLAVVALGAAGYFAARWYMSREPSVQQPPPQGQQQQAQAQQPPPQGQQQQQQQQQARPQAQQQQAQQTLSEGQQQQAQVLPQAQQLPLLQVLKTLQALEAEQRQLQSLGSVRRVRGSLTARLEAVARRLRILERIQLNPLAGAEPGVQGVELQAKDLSLDEMLLLVHALESEPGPLVIARLEILRGLQDTQLLRLVARVQAVR